MNNQVTIDASILARAAYIIAQDAAILDAWAATLAKDKGRADDAAKLREWAVVRRAAADELNQAL